MLNQKVQNNIHLDEIENYIGKLKTELPAKPTLHNFPFEYFFDTENYAEEIKTEELYQLLADKMCAFLMLPFRIKIFFADHLKGAGKYEKMEGMQHIFISSDITYHSAEQKLAILAHEMTHAYLFHHGVFLEDELENEILTDIAAIYLGFGNLIFAGYHSYFVGLDKKNKGKRIDNYTQSEIGYIDLLSIRNAIIVTARIRKQNPILVIKGIKYRHNRFFLRIHLHETVKAYKKVMEKSGNSIVETRGMKIAGRMEAVFKMSKWIPMQRKEKFNDDDIP
jgi:hypothetical protein